MQRRTEGSVVAKGGDVPVLKSRESRSAGASIFARSRGCVLLVAVLGAATLTSCGGRQVRADAPLITPCLDAPTAYVPDEPQAPADGAPIPDSYVVALKGWANSLLGVVTQDRIAWRGERRCIRRFQEEGQVR